VEILSLADTLFITIPHAKAIPNACCGIFITIVAKIHGQFFFSIFNTTPLKFSTKISPPYIASFLAITGEFL
jgi:hypothetical protein